MIVVSAAILVVGLLTMVLLLIKTVTLNISPDRAAESSTLASTKGFSIVLGRNVHFFGAVEVKADADGFFPDSVALDGTTESPVNVELKPQPGLISIDLNFLQDESRSEYSLLADGTQFFEPVPESIELPAGRHELRVRGPQEYDSTQIIKVDGYGSKQVVRFSALPRGSFSVKVLPANAEIKLNGTVIGVGEVHRTVVAKGHVLEFETQGYLAKRLPFGVDPNAHVDLGTVNLASAPGTVEFVSSPTSASILVDGIFVGSTPTKLEFNKSSVNVELRKPNFHSVSTTVQVEPGNTITQEFSLQAVRFDVEVSSQPPARLAVNDEDHGSTPVAVNVTAGDILVVTKEGYASQKITIAPEGQQERQIDFVLLDMEQHLYNKAQELLTVQDSIQLKKFPSAKFRLLVPGYLMEDNRRRT